MGEQSLVDLEKGTLVVDKQVKDVCFVLACDIAHFHAVLGELRQFQKTLLELFGFF